MNSVPAESLAALSNAALWPAPVTPPVDDEEFVRPATLREQPAWVRDAAHVSQRARAMLERARIAVVTVLAYWDHQKHSIAINGTTLSVDASGCYRRGA